MKIKKVELIKSLNKIFRKEKVNRIDFDNFKSELQLLLSKVDESESEEHLKYPLRDFLLRTSFSENEINTKGRTDLVIYSGDSNQKPINVIFEVKKPKSNEFITNENINCKALHESILYYIRERIEEKNDEIKHIIITNVYEWYIFDAHDFEKYFFVETSRVVSLQKNCVSLQNEYEKWKTGQKTAATTEHFYKIVSEYIANFEDEIPATYFDLRNYAEQLNISEIKLVPLFKILSATHLLKQSFATDSNSLNTQFYNELLYIIGLQEVNEGTKKVIKRINENERKAGSFIENTITTIQTENRLFNKGLQPLDKFGETEEEQLFTIALELSIAWINRILFLKLLEAQLIRFHQSEDYKFLDFSIISNYSELNELFFDVLNKQINERADYIKPELKNIPYLNSSLFEISRLENDAIRINSLKDRLTIPVFSQTVLKDQKGNRLKTEKATLEYLFDFLNAYNFSNEGADEIQEENKSLVNASVLGLIFEKINGYKEGSFFTPGYITMYMSRETIRRAVIQKFKEAGYQLSESSELSESFQELKTKIENREEANRIINSIKIIDPAVGSGHFLVSALNELIAIKSELVILSYKSGKRILDFKVEVVHDDLVITNLETEEIFEYTLNQKGNIIPYKQDLQEAIFHEKQTIIENCLFGVDINPNSVNICRLRLWIELLKHTYYKNPAGFELETLPNIDINIKQGNSLISNFGMNGNGQSNGKSQKIRLATQKYKDQVILYKSTNNKKIKQDAEQKIAEIKTMFSEVVRPLDKDYRLLKEKEAQLGQMPMLFSREDFENWETKRAEIQAEIEDLKKKLDEKNKTIYKNVFEWRFEFPEVLDENGNFEGFDIVMGNPPWVSLMGKHKGIDNKKVIEYYKTIFPDNTYMPNLYEYFVSFGFTLLKNKGLLAFITPDRLGKNENLQYVRKKLIENYALISYVYHWDFPGIVADTMTIIAEKCEQNDYIISTKYKPYSETIPISKKQIIDSNFVFVSYKTQAINLLIEKIKCNSVFLKEIAKTTSGFGGKSALIKTKQTNKNQIKVVKGENVTPYMLVGNFYFNFDMKNITGRTRDLNKLTKKEKIFLRKTGNKIISCYDDSGIVPEQSVYFIYDIISDILPLYLTALLNSKLMTFYYQNELVTNIESIAQLKNSDLYKIPIVKTDKQKQNEIAEIVLKIIEQKELKNHTTKLEAQIDKIVYKLYNLTKKEIAEIKKYYEQR